jgi:hypothetical protein
LLDGKEPMTRSDPGSESPRDRKRLARQAGLGRLSFISVLAGVPVAYGAFVLLAPPGRRGRRRRRPGHRAGQQRLGRLGAIVASQTNTEAIQANLRSLGLPVTAAEWARIGTVAGIGTLVGMLVGAGIGGVVGERWHGEMEDDRPVGNR